MIAAIIVLSLISLLLMWQCSKNDSELSDLKGSFIEFRNQTTFKLLSPQIEEYLTIKGYTKCIRYGNRLYFGVLHENDSGNLKMSELEDELNELKSAIKRACPKKCTKPKKK